MDIHSIIRPTYSGLHSRLKPATALMVDASITYARLNKYLPSYLVLARLPGEAIHVLFAADVGGDNVRVITAYRPSRDEWADDLKTRRAPQ